MLECVWHSSPHTRVRGHCEQKLFNQLLQWMHTFLQANFYLLLSIFSWILI